MIPFKIEDCSSVDGRAEKKNIAIIISNAGNNLSTRFLENFIERFYLKQKEPLSLRQWLC
jgi:hypothetical protein